MKYWEVIADNLKKAGRSLGCVSAVDPEGRTRVWKAFEAPGVEPVFPTKDDTLGYAPNRAQFRTGEIRVLDLTGNVERVIEFKEADRRL